MSIRSKLEAKLDAWIDKKRQDKLNKMTDEDILDLVRNKQINREDYYFSDEYELVFNFIKRKMSPIGDAQIEKARKMATARTDLQIRGKPEEVIERFVPEKFNKLLIESSLPPDVARVCSCFINCLGPSRMDVLMTLLVKISNLTEEDEAQEKEVDYE